MSQIKTHINKYGQMDRLTMDTIESLTPDNLVNTCIIIIIDNFTRSVELYLSKDNSTHVGCYSAPNQMRYKQHFTMEYSKEESALVKRAYKRVMRHLRNILFDRNLIEKWSTYLPLVQRKNNSLHLSIGVTPTQIVSENIIDFDRGILF